jgi:hypothetical protein
MGEMTREELLAMTDQKLLGYQREHHGDPYVTLAEANVNGGRKLTPLRRGVSFQTTPTAKKMQRVALQFWHVGAARTKVDREAQEARRRLHQKLFPSAPAVVLESDG